MPDGLLRAKIKEALDVAGQNRRDAHKLLLTWAVRDHALLLALTKPHLKAIASGAIDHYWRRMEEALPEDEGTDGFSSSTIDDIVASGTMLNSGDKRKSTVPPPKSTERQASTMRRLAAAFTKKK